MFRPAMEHMKVTDDGYYDFRDCYWLNEIVPESILQASLFSVGVFRDKDGKENILIEFTE